MEQAQTTDDAGNRSHDGPRIGAIPLSREATGLIRFAWYWMAFGLFIGCFMGMYSFDGPLPSPSMLREAGGEVWADGNAPPAIVLEQIQYTSVSRRLLRLGHIAFIALSIISILYAHFIDQTRLSSGKKTLAINLVKIGLVGIPSICVLASLWLPIKFLFCIPGPAMTAGVVMLAWGLAEPPGDRVSA